MSNESIDKLARMLAEELPQGLKSMRDELEQNFRAVLKSGLDKLDLVTREEFEVQEAILRRAREQLERLDARLKEMESATAKSAARKSKPARKAAGKSKPAKKAAGKKRK
ncbi:MAG: accessory factor UbiK family protein, partial [Woeseiaceae bacterium]|nr:accessory factor UbiK family protein [Woeseiaceae bacterium]